MRWSSFSLKDISVIPFSRCTFYPSLYLTDFLFSTDNAPLFVLVICVPYALSLSPLLFGHNKKKKRLILSFLTHYHFRTCDTTDRNHSSHKSRIHDSECYSRSLHHLPSRQAVTWHGPSVRKSLKYSIFDGWFWTDLAKSFQGCQILALQGRFLNSRFKHVDVILNCIGMSRLHLPELSLYLVCIGLG